MFTKFAPEVALFEVTQDLSSRRLGISAVTGAHFSSIKFPLIDPKSEEVYSLIKIFLEQLKGILQAWPSQYLAQRRYIYEYITCFQYSLTLHKQLWVRQSHLRIRIPVLKCLYHWHLLVFSYTAFCPQFKTNVNDQLIAESGCSVCFEIIAREIGLKLLQKFFLTFIREGIPQSNSILLFSSVGQDHFPYGLPSSL